MTDRWPRALLRAGLVPNRVPLRVPVAEVAGFARAAVRREYRRSQVLNGVAPILRPADGSAVAVPGAIAVAAVDVTAPLPPVDVGSGEELVVLTRGPAAIGRLEVPVRRHPWCARAWREAIVDAIGVEVLAACDHRPADDVRGDAIARLRAAVRPLDRAADGRPPCSATIVIATLDRPADLDACLARVVAQQSRHPFDVVVVDNNPASGLTGSVCDRFPTVRRVDEPRTRPGLRPQRRVPGRRR